MVPAFSLARAIRFRIYEPDTSGYEIHHLIEQRLLKQNPALREFFKNADDIPGVNITKAQHQVFTNAWRQKFPYSNQADHIRKLSIQRIYEAAEEIYASEPAMVRAILVRLLPGG